MAVQIPTLKRTDPVAPESAGRVKAELPDMVKPQAKINAETEDLGKHVVSYFEQQENQAIDDLETQADNDYQIAYRTRMYGDGDKVIGVKDHEGDPTELHAQFEKGMDEDFKRISRQGDSNLSGLARERVLKRLQARSASLEMQTLSEFSTKQAKWWDQQLEIGIKLSDGNLIDASSRVDPNDTKNGFLEFDLRRRERKELIIKNALKIGGAVHDDNGTEYYTNDQGEKVRVAVGSSADYRLKMSESDGITSAIQNLISTGHVDKALALQKRYSSQIDAANKVKLNKSIESETVEQLSKRLAYGDKKALDGISDPVKKNEIRASASKITRDNERTRQDHLNMSAKASFGAGLRQLKALEDAGHPIKNRTDFMNDPTLKELYNRISIVDPKKAMALIGSLEHEKPKRSDGDALSKVQRSFFAPVDGQYAWEMDDAKFQEMLSGLDTTDSRYYSRNRFTIMSTSDSQEQTKHTYANTIIEKTAFDMKMVKKDTFGKYDAKNQAKLDELYRVMGPVLDATRGRTVGDTELRTMVTENLTSFKANKNVTIPERPKYAPGKPAPKKSFNASYSTDEKKEMAREYAKTHPGVTMVDALEELRRDHDQGN